MGFFSKLLPSRNERLLKSYQKTIASINAFEADLRLLDDTGLRAKTDEFRARLKQGESFQGMLPEIFAVVREASRRVLGMRHYDVQMIGGLVLNEGKIAEMRTGEGKTLVATLPAYANALTGKGVHIITVNDYLARRDTEWMGKIYEFLGLKVGVIVSGQSPEERKDAYAADVTYGTNNEFGFDYLRDNMVLIPEHRVQCRRHFAVVDEVDSILIDEARTPLVISGPVEDRPELYQIVDGIVKKLKPAADENEEGDCTVEEKSKQVFLTEQGHERIEKLLIRAEIMKADSNLYDTDNLSLLHHVNAALRARLLFRRNVDYLVRDGKVMIVDEFTGRVMSGRRWSEGLHQALEAKEKVEIQNENQTLASITFQNYFRLYETLSGMTGTADTEAYEFQQIYGLEVVVIPTDKEMRREDLSDLVYVTATEKFEAIIEDIKNCVQGSQPVLVGTASIAVSEHLSKVLKKEEIDHKVLNAKHHEQESMIIANAGCPGAVTIATNMAGRGTDIVLGGAIEANLTISDEDADIESESFKRDWEERNKKVIAAGGLHIIGTERHESRRIDNQLRGRSGRQGDPGSSRFYLSLEDNLMRIFAGDKVKAVMGKLGVEKGEAIEHPWVNRAISNAQKKVEGHNFDIRKSLLEYDDIASEQRKLVYQQREELIDSDDISDDVENILTDVVGALVDRYLPPDAIEEDWDIKELELVLQKDFAIEYSIGSLLKQEKEIDQAALAEKVIAHVRKIYQAKEASLGVARLRQVEKLLMLRFLDLHWKEHLAAMDYLRQGIGLRGFAQKNPRQEYKREAFEMFDAMLQRVRYDFISRLVSFEIEAPPEELKSERIDQEKKVIFRHDEAGSALYPLPNDEAPAASSIQAPNRQTGRMSPISTPQKQKKEMKKAFRKASKRLTTDQLRSVAEKVSAGQSMDDAMEEVSAGSAPGGRTGDQELHTVRRDHPKLGRNDPCHCGSGKKFKRCHGKVV